MFTTLEILGILVLLLVSWKLLGVVGVLLVSFIVAFWILRKKQKAGQDTRRNRGLDFLFGARQEETAAEVPVSNETEQADSKTE